MLIRHKNIKWKNKWWPGAELNCRHADFQSAALPTELPGPVKKGPVPDTGKSGGRIKATSRLRVKP